MPKEQKGWATRRFLTPEGSWVSCRADAGGAWQQAGSPGTTSDLCPSSQLPSRQEAHEDSEV